jgi:hypothetical protein
MPSDVASLQRTLDEEKQQSDKGAGGDPTGGDPLERSINMINALLGALANMMGTSVQTLTGWFAVSWAGGQMQTPAFAPVVAVIAGTYVVLRRLYRVHLNQRSMEKVILHYKLFDKDLERARKVLGDVNIWKGLKDDPEYLMYWMLRVAKDFLRSVPEFPGQDKFSEVIRGVRDTLPVMTDDMWALVVGNWQGAVNLLKHEKLAQEMGFSQQDIHELEDEHGTGGSNEIQISMRFYFDMYFVWAYIFTDAQRSEYMKYDYWNLFWGSNRYTRPRTLNRKQYGFWLDSVRILQYSELTPQQRAQYEKYKTDYADVYAQ